MINKSTHINQFKSGLKKIQKNGLHILSTFPLRKKYLRGDSFLSLSLKMILKQNNNVYIKINIMCCAYHRYKITI